MPDQYDGSVIIDTELDHTGFEKGSEKLKAAMRGFTKALDSMAGNAARAFQEPIKAPEIAAPDDSGLEAAIAEFEEHEKELAKTAKEVFDDADASELTEQYQSADAAAKRLAERQKALRKLMQEKEDDAFAESHAASEKVFEHYASVIERNADAAAKALDRMQRASETGFRNSSQVLAQNAGLDAAAQKIQALKAALSELGEYQLLDEEQQERFEEMRNQLEQSEKALETNVKLIRQEEIERQRANVLIAQEKVANAGNALTRKLALAELQKAQDQLAAVAQKSVTPAPDPKAASAWQRFGGIMKNVGSAAKRAGSMTLKGVTLPLKGIKALASGTKNLLSHMKKSGGGADGLLRKLTGLKTMLTSRIKQTFINFLFEQIQESFKVLAQFDSRFDRSVSNIRNRTKELGANIMGTFGGIVRDFEPYITALIGKASDAVTKINAAISALRGESTMQVAVRQTESYADSLRDATKEAKAAKSAQDKLNATLTSYDEIHKLADNNAAADDTNAGSEAERELYQNVPVGSILRNMDDNGKKIVDRLVQAVKDGDWKGAGDAIAAGLNLGVRKLDEAILGARERVVNGARGIAEALNGLTDGFDAYALGKTLADGVELGLDAAYSFLTTYDFGKFGKRIADGVNGFATNLDAEKVGRAIAAGINAAINFGFDLVTNIKWDVLGEKFGTAVSRIFRDVDWGKAARMVSAGIVGVINSIASFIETMDTQEAGKALAEFITNIDWVGLSKAMFRLLGAAIGDVGGLIKGAFEAIAEKSSNWGEHLFDKYGKEFDAAGDNVAEGIWNGIKTAFKDVGKKIKSTIFDPFIKGFKNAFGIASPAKEMTPYGEYVGEGILEGVSGVFNNVSDWVRRNILEPFKRGFTTAFNVAGDKARALIDSGKSIAGGIKDGISNGWTSITTLLDQKKSDLTTTGSNFASSISSGISGAWSTVTAAVDNGLNSLGNIDTSKLTSAGEKLVAGLKDGITGGGWDSMVGKVWERYGDLVNWLSNNGREGFKQSGEYMVDGLNEGLRERFSITLETVQNGGQAAVDAFNKAVGISSPSKAMAESGRYMMDGLTLGIQQESIRTYNAIRTVAAGIVDEVDSTELTPEIGMTTKGLDRVADKLAQIAQIFQTINRAFTDFTRVPLPAIVTGAYAPAGTRVTDISGSGLTEIKQLLGRFLDRAAELEEKIDSRPVRVDVHAEIDKREIARATAEVRQDSNNINNGGGRW